MTKKRTPYIIQLRDEKFQCRTVRVTSDISLDFAAGEQLIGIELPGMEYLDAVA